jgi:hypothetical protein
MSDFDDLFTRSEEDEFGDFLRWLRPGRKVNLTGMLRYREGSDAQDWAEPGGAKYLPREWQILAGSIKWSGAAATSGVVEVTFPAKFSGLPLVYVTPINTTPLFKDIRCQAPLASAEAMEIWWFAGASLTEAIFCWLAIGPIGLS